jgi:predicted RNase H-like HicB family nuclease
MEEMEELTVFLTRADDGAYLAQMPLIPDLFIRGSSPEEAFEKMKQRAEKWIQHKGLKIARLIFRAEFSRQHSEDAKAAHERGECQELDAALAEIAGVSLDEWRERVDGRKGSKDR